MTPFTSSGQIGTIRPAKYVRHKQYLTALRIKWYCGFCRAFLCLSPIYFLLSHSPDCDKSIEQWLHGYVSLGAFLFITTTIMECEMYFGSYRRQLSVLRSSGYRQLQGTQSDSYFNLRQSRAFHESPELVIIFYLDLFLYCVDIGWCAFGIANLNNTPSDNHARVCGSLNAINLTIFAALSIAFDVFGSLMYNLALIAGHMRTRQCHARHTPKHWLRRCCRHSKDRQSSFQVTHAPDEQRDMTGSSYYADRDRDDVTSWPDTETEMSKVQLNRN